MFRLKELRLENGMKRSEFAALIKLPASTVANYENETRQAPYDLIIAFADFFGVSTDYLLGRTDDFDSATKEPPVDGKILTATEKELLSEYRKCSELGKNRILEYAKMWKNNRTEQ